eukprot:Ihof_evm2s453 gene=Ihof_evmTU2s453
MRNTLPQEVITEEGRFPSPYTGCHVMNITMLEQTTEGYLLRDKGLLAELAAGLGQIQGQLTRLQQDDWLLSRLLYRSRSQHRRSVAFNSLMEVHKLLRRLHALQTLQAAKDLSTCYNRVLLEVDDTDWGQSYPSPENVLGLLQRLILSQALGDEVMDASQAAISHLQGMLAQTHFMSFALGTLALVARLAILLRALQPQWARLYARLLATGQALAHHPDTFASVREGLANLPSAMNKHNSLPCDIPPMTLDVSVPEHPMEELGISWPNYAEPPEMAMESRDKKKEPTILDNSIIKSPLSVDTQPGVQTTEKGYHPQRKVNNKTPCKQVTVQAKPGKGKKRSQGPPKNSQQGTMEPITLDTPSGHPRSSLQKTSNLHKKQRPHPPHQVSRDVNEKVSQSDISTGFWLDKAVKVYRKP